MNRSKDPQPTLRICMRSRNSCSTLVLLFKSSRKKSTLACVVTRLLPISNTSFRMVKMMESGDSTAALKGLWRSSRIRPWFLRNKRKSSFARWSKSKSTSTTLLNCLKIRLIRSVTTSTSWNMSLMQPSQLNLSIKDFKTLLQGRKTLI